MVYHFLLFMDICHLITDVWVAGDSYITKLQIRAYNRHIEYNLGASNVQNVQWIHEPGMHWPKLLPEIQFHALHSYPPRAMIIHVGSNDLATVKGVELIHTMKEDIQHLVDTYPNTKIMFSAMFPRMVWTRTNNPEKMEPKRKFINRVIRRFLQYQGRGVFIEHPEITSDTPGLYDRDGVHLSDIGSDIFMLDIREALRINLLIQIFWGKPIDWFVWRKKF